MKASETKLLEFLKKSPQFVIPIYQRTYSWTEPQCRQLWNDVLRAGRDEKVAGHFIGSIVYIQKDLYQVTIQTPLLVIDGQQRLTTVTLLIAALMKALGKFDDGSREPVEGFSPVKLKSYYLVNPLEDGEKHYKLILSQTDKATLTALVGGHPMPANSSLRVTANFEFFEDQIAQSLGDIKALCQGLSKLMLVDVALSRGQDNPQLIFESMNSTGLALTQADLIRNYILMGLDPEIQTCLYEQYWRPMEEEFGQEAYSSHFDSFMRHYLTVKMGGIPRQDKVYAAFKKHAPDTAMAPGGVEALVKDIRTYAGYYCAMVLRGEKDHGLSDAFQDILFELLLKLGLDLTVPMEQRQIAGKTVHSIGAGSLLVCLSLSLPQADAEPLALGIIEWHKAQNPAGETTIVFRDSAFADDVAKTNLSAILEQNGLGNVRSL